MMTTKPKDRIGASAPDPYRWHCVGLVVVFSITIPALMFLMISKRPRPVEDPLIALAAVYGVDPVELGSGRFTFASNCAICHGKTGEGVPRLGKPLRNSEFVQEHSDEELLEIIFRGRAAGDPENTSGTAMPARGMLPDVNDRRLSNVVTFLRTIQDSSQPFASVEDWIVRSPAGVAVSDVSGIGHEAFLAACSACHGATGEGLPGLGKTLADSPFVDGKSDEELLKFVKQGRPIWDSENTTGIDMPPKGGNPAISDEQLAEIIVYIRRLHESKSDQ